MALPRLEDRAGGVGEVEIVALDRLSAELDPALVDHAAPVARRFAQLLRQERRQVDLRLGHAYLGDVVGRLVLADHPREVLLTSPRPLLPMPARDDPPSELELPLHRI